MIAQSISHDDDYSLEEAISHWEGEGGISRLQMTKTFPAGTESLRSSAACVQAGAPVFLQGSRKEKR